MLYKINRHCDTEQEPSYFLLECPYSETEMLSLIATLQYYAEELFGDSDIFLNSDCLKLILCNYFQACDADEYFQHIISKISIPEEPANQASWVYMLDSGRMFIQINRYLTKNLLNAAECQKNIRLWISENPDKEKALRELIFKEGIE